MTWSTLHWPVSTRARSSPFPRSPTRPNGTDTRPRAAPCPASSQARSRLPDTTSGRTPPRRRLPQRRRSDPMTTVTRESRTKGDTPMKRLVLFAALATTIATGIDVAAAAELPTYESAGFPITALQVSVVGSAHVQEAPSVPTLTLHGMPASPNQIEVLTAGNGSKPKSPQQRAEATR